MADFLTKPPLDQSLSAIVWQWCKQVFDQFYGMSFPEVVTTTTTLNLGSKYAYPIDTTGGNCTCLLPLANKSIGKFYLISKTDAGANHITITRQGTDTISGLTSLVVDQQYQSVEVYSDGQSTWYIKFNSVPTTPAAPADAKFVMIGNDSRFSQERALTAGTGVTITDNGPNSTVVISASGGGASPLTTKGDVWGYSTVDARIPVGANTFVLTADSTQALGVKWAAPGGGSGTVTSVAQTVPNAEFTITGSPITTSGTLAIGKQVQNAHNFWGGPVSGAAAQPTFRPIDPSDASAIGFFPLLWGGGTDGSFTLDGTATPAWASRIGSIYTQTRDCAMVNLTVNSGITLNCKGCRIYGQGILTNNGTIAANGLPGAAGTGGQSAGAITIGQGTQGGGRSATTGGQGVATTNGLGGVGGAGGSATNAGGAGGLVATIAPAGGGTEGAYTALGIIINMAPSGVGGPALFSYQGGSGGGGGGSAGVGAGGAGGGGGGWLVILFYQLAAGATGVFTANGGAGETSAGGATAGGGGGGGGGGCVRVVSTSPSSVYSAQVSVAGGAPGNPNPAGGNVGIVGNVGRTIFLQVF